MFILAELFDEEKKHLLPLPEEQFEARRIELRNANSLSAVRFHYNDYSVPTEHAHKPIIVIGNLEQVQCLVGDQVVAVHKRDWGKDNAHYSPVHYLAIVERKPNSLEFGKPFANGDLPKEFDVLHRRFVAAAGRFDHLAKRLPQHIRQKANQNMRQHAIFFLMPNRANSQIIFFNAKRGFGQLNVRLPKFLRRPVGDVRSQQITAFTQYDSAMR